VTEKDDTTAGKERLIDRRSVLTLTGSAAAATLLGVGGASAQTTPSKYMLLDTTSTEEVCHYVVEASEAIEVVPTDGNDVATATDTRVEGAVDQGYVAIRYAGWVSTIEIDGRAYVRFGDSAEELFPDTGRKVVVTSPTEVDYRFTATEDVERIEDGSRNAAETRNDSITENDDGTVTADGFTGNGYGDSFTVYGDVTEFTLPRGATTRSPSTARRCRPTNSPARSPNRQSGSASSRPRRSTTPSPSRTAPSASRTAASSRPRPTTTPSSRTPTAPTRSAASPATATVTPST